MELDELRIKIRADANGVNKVLSNLEKQLSNIKEQVNKKFEINFKIPESSLDVMEQLKQYLNDLSGLTSCAKTLLKISSGFWGIANAVDRLDFSKLAKMYNYLSNMGIGKGEKPTIEEGEVDETPGVEEAADDIENLGNKTKEADKNAKSLDKSLEKIGRTAKKTTSKLSSALSRFIEMFKRRLMYRLINAIISLIQNAFKEGFKNLYYFSELTGGPFKQTMDTLTTAALYLKNSFAAMVAPLMNAVAPILDKIADTVVDIANFVNQTISMMTGAETWTKALKFPKSYEDALGGANKKAKELQKTLFKFDEINRFDGQNKGSSGSGYSDEDYLKMFEVVDTPKKTEDILKLDKAFSDLGSNIEDYLGTAYENTLVPIGEWFTNEDENGVNGFTKALEGMNKVLEGAKPVWDGFTTAVGGFGVGTLDAITEKMNSLGDSISRFGTIFKEEFPGKKELDGKKNAWFEFGEAWGKQFIEMILGPVDLMQEAVVGLIEVLTGRKSLTEAFIDFANKLAKFLNVFLDGINAFGKLLGFDWNFHIKTVEDYQRDYIDNFRLSSLDYASGPTSIEKFNQLLENPNTMAVAQQNTARERITISATDISTSLSKAKLIQGTR